MRGSESDDSYDESGSEDEIAVKKVTQPSSKPSPTEATTTTTTTTTTIPSAQPTSTTTETTKETITVPSVEPTPVPVEVSAPASEKEVPSPAAPVEVSAPAPQICDGCHKAVPVIKGVAAPVMTLDDHPGMVFCNQQCLPKDERSRKLSAAAEHAPRSKSPGFRERRRLKKEKKAREKAASKK